MSFDGKEDAIKKQIAKVLGEKLDKAFTKIFDQAYSEKLKGRITKRTQLGIGLDRPKSDKGIRLPPLSSSYKSQRKKKDFKLSSTTTASKSNLTATGQLLKSLSLVKLKVSTGIKWVIVVGDRRGRDARGKPSKIGNKQLVKYLEDQGRIFLGFSRAQINEVQRELKEGLKKFLK